MVNIGPCCSEKGVAFIMLLLWDILPKKRMSNNVGSLPYFCFCQDNGLHLRCFPAFMSIWARCIFCPQPSCFRAGGGHFRLVPDICIWYHSPDFEADWSPTHMAPAGFWNAEPWAPSRRGGGVWVGSQGEVCRDGVNASDVTWTVLMKTFLSASGKTSNAVPVWLSCAPACGLPSSSQKAVSSPDSLLRSVFQRMYTVSVTLSGQCVVCWWLTAWSRYQRAFLAPSRGQEGAPQNCSLRSCEGPPGRSHTQEHGYSSSPLLLLKDSRNWWPGSLRLPHQFILRMPSGWVSLWLQGSEGKSPILCVSRQNA